MLEVWGTRGAAAPLTTIWPGSSAARRASSRSRSIAIRAGATRAALEGGQRRGHAHRQRHRLGAGPQASLLRSADQQGLERDAVADEQRADALRPMKLVGRRAHQVDAQGAKSTGSLPTICAASV